MRFFNKLLAFLLVLSLSFWAVKPLLLPGFFPMHDDTQPARVFEMAKALSGGQFPVRWVQDLGYGFGYPLFNFYAPLPYYIGAIFNLAGFDVIAATKMMFIIGILLSAVSMYLLVAELVGNIAGIVAAILYMYAPYHAVTIYVRGAVGEFYAFALLPLVALGIIKIISFTWKVAEWTPSRCFSQLKQGIIIGSIGLAGVLLSHNILGMITGFFFAFGLLIYFIYSLISRQKLFTFYFLLFTVFLGLGLSSFFTLPAIVEKDYTKVQTLTSGGSNFRQHFVYLDQLWDSPWGFAGSAPGRADGMSFKIGKIHLIFGIVSLLIVLISYRTNRSKKKNLFTVYCLLFIFSISIFFMLEQSKPIWEIFPMFSYIQYPWRLLNFAILSLSVLSVFLFMTVKDRLFQIILAIGIIAVTLWFNLKYFSPQEYLTIKPEDYISDINLRYKISKISDEYLPKDFEPPKSINQIAWQGIASTDEVETNTVKEESAQKKYSLSIKRPAKLVTNIAFFPGWRAYLDGQNIKIRNNEGRIGLDLPEGLHELQFTFGNTRIRTVANTISLFSIFLLVYVSLFWGKCTLWKRNT